ncbi:hypothetical protein ABE187_09695 [Bacillus cabrialesii]|uniref:hypothetical protein n=2 Tax=Bacillus cabrialesii TaxID=2487276 RepID=UPI003D231A21
MKIKGIERFITNERRNNVNIEQKKKLIPQGSYCYNEDKLCPFWSVREDRSAYENGYCSYMEKGDWDINKESTPETGLLWDQVKECGEKLDQDDWRGNMFSSFHYKKD